MDLLTAIQDFFENYYSTFSYAPFEGRERDKLIPDIRLKASINWEYRQSLLKNSRRTLQYEGLTFPEEFHLKFVEDTEDTIYIPILPFLKEEPEKRKAVSERPGEHHIIVKASLDRPFRNALIKKPMEVLKKEGFYIPESKEIKILESTDNLLYVVLPPFKKNPT